MNTLELGDEVEIIGSARYKNGYPIGTIGNVVDYYEHDYIITKKGENTRESWFSYPLESIKKSKAQLRKEKIDKLL